MRASALALAAMVGLASCGAEENLEDFSAQELYERAETRLEAPRRAAAAAEAFQDVERLYPYSPWAKRALIMEAYAHYKAKEFDQARTSAVRFLESYPEDEDAPYAAYLVALSHYDQIDDVGQDLGAARQALQAFRTVIANYPNSDYARASQLKMDLATDQIAGKEVDVGRYYLKQGNYTAAINRFRRVIEEYQSSSYVPEALHRLAEAYLALGLRDQAQTAAAILGHNYRSSPFYADSYKLLNGEVLPSNVRETGWLGAIYRQTLLGQWL